jgi:hypothetical protein
MAWFKRESSTHYIRDSNNKVIGVTHAGDEDRRENIFDRSAQKRQANREVRQRERGERRYDRRVQKEAEREAQRKAYNEERLKVRAERGRQAAHHPITAMLPPRRIVHVHVGKKQYQKQQFKKKKQMTPMEFQKRMMKGF